MDVELFVCVLGAGKHMYRTATTNHKLSDFRGIAREGVRVLGRIAEAHGARSASQRGAGHLTCTQRNTLGRASRGASSRRRLGPDHCHNNVRRHRSTPLRSNCRRRTVPNTRPARRLHGRIAALGQRKFARIRRNFSCRAWDRHTRVHNKAHLYTSRIANRPRRGHRPDQMRQQWRRESYRSRRWTSTRRGPDGFRTGVAGRCSDFPRNPWSRVAGHNQRIEPLFPT